MTQTEKQSSGQELWESATWEGARREQLRRWAKLPLERILKAQEEMHDLSRRLADMPRTTPEEMKK